MNTMYLKRKRHYRKKKLHTFFIGKRILIWLFLILTVSLDFASAYFAFKFSGIGFSADIQRYFVTSAIPLAGASAKDDMRACERDFVNMITGTSFGNPGLNFKAVPVFYHVNRIERNVLAVSAGISSDVNAVKEDMALPAVKVHEQSNPAQGLKLKNETTYNIDVDALVKEPCDINLEHKEPEILIVHTHGSESYTQSEKYHYSQSDYSRCQDIRYNVVRVGDELENELKKRGFNVIHDRTINDYPSYNNSYNKTLGIIESYLKKYPSIKCVFDVHRDAITGENDEKIKFTADIKGEKVSQIMIVCGSDQLGLENPHWQKNLSTALKIQDVLNKKYPGLMRPVNLRKERFNLHKTTGSFIFEFGTHGNTLDEVLPSVKYLAEGIEDVLK